MVRPDPAPGLVDRARELASDLTNLTFAVADGRTLPFVDAEFDVVVFDSTLSHIPGPEQAIAEAFRVLLPRGVLAAFDGDYATTTVALADHDPLQACVAFMMANSVTDRHLVRRLPRLVRDAGFEPGAVESYGYVESGEGSYMLTIIDRGVDLLHAREVISSSTAAAMKDEARYRVTSGAFFGHIAYDSLVARKPAS